MTDLLQRVRDANPVPLTPPPPPIELLLERLNAEPPRPRRRRRTRRGAVLALAALAIAVPALATEPWEPILGDPSSNNRPAGVSESLPPAAQRGLLGVLRRPQNDADRGPIAQRLLREVGAEYKGVRLSSVRLLSSSDGHHVLLVPSEEHGQSSEPGKYEVTDDLCLQHASGSFCGGAEQIRSDGLVGAFGVIERGRVKQYNMAGLVPDGVARVVLTFPVGDVRTSDVRDNFFWVTDVPLEQRTVRVEPGGSSLPSTMTHTLPAEPKIEWFDASGRKLH